MGLDIHFASPESYKKYGEESHYRGEDSVYCNWPGRDAKMRVVDHMPHFSLRGNLKVSLEDLITIMFDHIKFYSKYENINSFKYPSNFKKYWSDERLYDSDVQSDIDIMRAFTSELLASDVPLDWIVYGDW